MPRVTSFASPAAPDLSGSTNSCARAPLAQVSQWRTKIRSWSTPLGPFLAAFSWSSKRCLLQASVSQSANTSIDTTSRSPLGASRKLPTSSGSCVTAWASPSTPWRQTWVLPPRVDRKYSVLPSADQRGVSELPVPAANLRRSCVVRSISQIERTPLLAARSVVRTT